MYPQPGSYQNAYPPPAPYGQPYGQPYAQPWYPPPAYPQPQQDMSSMLLMVLLPVMMTMPGLNNAQTVAATLKTRLAAIPVPVAINGQPTADDLNNVLSYSKSVAGVLTDTLGNQQAALAVMRQSVTLGMLPALMGGGGGGGGNMMLVMVMMMMMMNLGGSGFGF